MDTEAPAPSMRCTGCCGHGGAEASYLHAPVSSEDVGQTWPKALGPRNSGYHDLDLIVSLLSLCRYSILLPSHLSKHTRTSKVPCTCYAVTTCLKVEAVRNQGCQQLILFSTGYCVAMPHPACMKVEGGVANVVGATYLCQTNSREGESPRLIALATLGEGIIQKESKRSGFLQHGF